MSLPSESTIQALAATITPSLENDAARLRRIYSNFAYVYGDLPDDTQTKLALLVRVIEGMSWLWYQQSFSSLDRPKRERLCQSMADAPVGRLQAGFSGLRSLVLNATYTEPVMWNQIAYDGPTIDRGGATGRDEE